MNTNPDVHSPVQLSSVETFRLNAPVQIELDAPPQSCKKITILDRKDRDLFIDLYLLHDLDQFIDLLKSILIFDLQNWR